MKNQKLIFVKDKVKDAVNDRATPKANHRRVEFIKK